MAQAFELELARTFRRIFFDETAYGPQDDCGLSAMRQMVRPIDPPPQTKPLLQLFRDYEKCKGGEKGLEVLLKAIEEFSAAFFHIGSRSNMSAAVALERRRDLRHTEYKYRRSYTESMSCKAIAAVYEGLFYLTHRD